MWRQVLSPSRLESLRSLHLNSQNQHQAIIKSPLQPNWREDAWTVATVRTVWVGLRRFYLKSWQQRLESVKQQEKQDKCDRLGIEMAEGEGYYTDPCMNSILFYSRDSSILDKTQLNSSRQLLSRSEVMSSQQPLPFIKISCKHYRLRPMSQLNMKMTVWAIMGQGIYSEDPWTL